MRHTAGCSGSSAKVTATTERQTRRDFARVAGENLPSRFFRCSPALSSWLTRQGQRVLPPCTKTSFANYSRQKGKIATFAPRRILRSTLGGNRGSVFQFNSRRQTRVQFCLQPLDLFHQPQKFFAERREVIFDPRRYLRILNPLE